MMNPSGSAYTVLPDRRRIHVVGIPLGDLHGHVNPMLSFCTTLVARRDVHATLVVTEQWLRLASPLTLDAAAKSGRVKFVTLQNDALPPTAEGAVDLHVFHDAVATEMVGPVERLLDQLERPPDLILADGFLAWAVGVGKRRNVAVASFWPASASLFSVAFHQHLILAAHSFPLDRQLSGEERIDWIPGIPSIRLADLPGEIQINDKQILRVIGTAVTRATEAQCIIFRTTNELEEAALGALKTNIPVPIYAIGPTISYFTQNPEDQTPNYTPKDYIKWLDTQQPSSVLYISLGTCLPTLEAHVDELAAGVRESRVSFLWVARKRASHVSHIVGDRGKVVSWCDQMRVLMHPSIGGFLTHCGWNSTLEAAFSGVPALAFPIGIDQMLNSKLMVEDWGIGWRVKNNFQDLIKKEQISEILNKFMDLESLERKELDDKCKKFKERLLLGVAQDGSTSCLDEFFSMSLIS